MIWAISDEALHSTLAAVLNRLPHDALALVRGRLELATDDRERAVKAGGDVGGAASVSASGVLWLDAAALKRGFNWRYIESALAHELAHVVLDHHRASAKSVSHEAGEIAADKLAVSWGYDSLVSYETLYPQPIGGYPKTFGEIQL
jgi:hypothetical protein